MRVNSRAKYIETSIGKLSKTNKEDWILIYDKYLEFRSISETSKYFNISERTISKFLFKVFNFENIYDKVNCIYSNVGMLSKTNKEDWIPIYNKYIELGSCSDTANFFNVRPDTLSKYLFKVFNFDKLSKKDVYNNRTPKTKQTCLERYGVLCSANSERAREKAKETFLNKFGVDHNFKSKENREKANKTKEKKYGNRNYNNRDKFLETMEDKWEDRTDKIKETCFDKYGVSNPNKIKYVRDKIKNTCLDRYGVECVTQFEEIKNRRIKTNSNKAIKRWEDKYLKPNGYTLLQEFTGTHEEIDGEKFWKKYRFRHEACGEEFEGYFSVSSDKYMIRCKKCFPIVYGESQNKIIEFIESLGFETWVNRFDLISPYQIDIFIPELNIGFEYNGILWHSSKYKPNKNYHKDKTDLALKKGIKLYHIWEHDNEEIVKSKIKQILSKTEHRIYARKCEVREVSGNECREFLEDNHLRKFSSSGLYLGLYYEERLISLMSFRKDKSEMELNRFCNKINTSVVGGFSKLLKHAIPKIKELGYNKIITFAYRDWTPDYKNSVYLRNGFKFVRYGNPSLSYYNNNNGTVQNRQKFMKNKLRKLFPDVYDENLTEKEILEKKSIYALYNSGVIKFELDV